MEIRLSEDLRNRVEQELGSGGYRDFDEFVEEAVRYFLEDRQRGQRRRDALRRIGQAWMRRACTREFS